MSLLSDYVLFKFLLLPALHGKKTQLEMNDNTCIVQAKKIKEMIDSIPAPV